MTTDEARGTDPLLTVAEIAKALHCTERFIRQEIVDGKLAAFKISGKMVRVRKSAFDRYLDERATRRARAAA